MGASKVELGICQRQESRARQSLRLCHTRSADEAIGKGYALVVACRRCCCGARSARRLVGSRWCSCPRASSTSCSPSSRARSAPSHERLHKEAQAEIKVPQLFDAKLSEAFSFFVWSLLKEAQADFNVCQSSPCKRAADACTFGAEAVVGHISDCVPWELWVTSRLRVTPSCNFNDLANVHLQFQRQFPRRALPISKARKAACLTCPRCIHLNSGCGGRLGTVQGLYCTLAVIPG